MPKIVLISKKFITKVDVTEMISHVHCSVLFDIVIFIAFTVIPWEIPGI